MVSGYFGEISPESYRNYLAQSVELRSWVVDPNEASVPQHPPRVNDFGFWLPQGLGHGPLQALYQRIYSQVQVFNRIETAYKNFFRIPDEVLVLEHQQAAYLHRLASKQGPLKKPGTRVKSTAKNRVEAMEAGLQRDRAHSLALGGESQRRIVSH